MLNLNRTAVGLTRVSINLRKSFRKSMDCRVEPGNDGLRATTQIV